MQTMTDDGPNVARPLFRPDRARGRIALSFPALSALSLFGPGPLALWTDLVALHGFDAEQPFPIDPATLASRLPRWEPEAARKAVDVLCRLGYLRADDARSCAVLAC